MDAGPRSPADKWMGPKILTGKRPALEAANPDRSENLDQDVGQILMLYFLFAFIGCSGKFSDSLI